MHAVFAEVATLLIISAAAGAVALWLRQPVLIAYIVVGIVVGPAALGLVAAHDQIDLLAQIGVAVLLFVVGLKLDLRHVRQIGPVALATGLGQLGFTIVGGFLLILLLGKAPMEALYVAVALTFSSTIIIVKLLSDKRELDSLHGRIAVGFLIVQDLAVVLAMMVMSTLRTGGEQRAIMDVAMAVSARILIAAAALYVLMRFVLPRVVEAMARSQELLLVFAIAWGTGLAALGEWAGFSKEAGAFLAGFSLASTRYRESINARLTGIRDFLLLFFFIDLGSKLDLSTLGDELLPAAVLSAFVLIGNPLIVMAIMGYMGYRRRTGFLAGLTVAQISEFSIVFVAMGISLGHVGLQALGLTTLVGLVTIAVSTYMILYSHALYDRLAPWLKLFERRHPHREAEGATPSAHGGEPQAVIVGLGRYGRALALRLRERGVSVLGVDFDPDAYRRLRRAGIEIRFGDATEGDFLETLPIAADTCIVSTLPDLSSHRALVNALRTLPVQGRLSLVLREDIDASTAIELGNPIILHPMQDAIEHAVELLTKEMETDEATR